MDFEVYRSRLTATGENVRTEITQQSKFMFDNYVADDPSYTSVDIIRSDEIVGSINLRMDNYKFYDNVPRMDVHGILGNDIKFKLGDVFHTTVVEDNAIREDYWLCITENNLHGIQKDGTVEQCNYRLRWQNQNTYEIIERWCSVRDPYATGLSEGNVITTGNGKFKITLPHDEETKLLHVGKRFLIDMANDEPIPYSIVKYNAVTNSYASRGEGFLVINLDETVLRTNDNWELMLADYILPLNTQPNPVGNCKITTTGTNAIKAGGLSKKFFVEFYSTGGSPITTLIPNWELIFPDNLDTNKVVVLSQNENMIELKAADDAAIGAEFVLRMSVDDLSYGEFEAQYVVRIDSLF